MKTKEKILVGDILLYVPPLYVQGPSHHSQEGTVISINLQSKYKIELDTGDKLEDCHQVMRIRITKNGKLISHPGCLRSISSFVLDTQVSFSGQSSMMLTRHRKNIIQKCMTKSISKSPKEIQGLLESVYSSTLTRVSTTRSKTSNKRKFPDEYREIIKAMIDNEDSFEVSVNDVLKTLKQIEGDKSCKFPSKKQIAEQLKSLYNRKK